MAGYQFTGEKYNTKMTTKEIAKAVRDEVKAALKSGALPAGAKISVRLDQGSTSSSIYVTVKELPEGVCCPFTAEYLTYYKEARPRGFVEPFRGENRFVPPVAKMLRTLEEMLNAYNRDRSDTQSDYFNRRFWDNVSLDYNLEKMECYAHLMGDL